jgi:signal transduction histidine kinase
MPLLPHPAFLSPGLAARGEADGHGLGLSIVHAIATAHHAAITTRAFPREDCPSASPFRRPPAGARTPP